MPDDFVIIELPDFFKLYALMLHVNSYLPGDYCWYEKTEQGNWVLTIDKEEWPLYREDILCILKEEGYDYKCE